ncbi:MAG TPA: serine hydrolase [Ruminiclostridium sp.]|jgi:beta-lactamase class A|nr:serine hydrolase [Clostridiaceae bacterium]HAA26097.1 serine hydrolase [Ruminiclostridium sp.]
MIKSNRHKKSNTVKIILFSVILAALAFVAILQMNDRTETDGRDVTVITPPEGTNPNGDASEHMENEADAVTPTGMLQKEPTQIPTQTPSPTPAPTPFPRDMEALKKEIEEYISQQSAKYGMYFINLVNGDEFGINDKDEFVAASTTKLPMNLLLYKKIASGEIDPESTLIYLEEDFEPGSGIIQKSEYGTEYTVRETARLSIVYSDNCAINMIIRLLGIDNIRNYMQELGGTIYYGRRHRSCPYDIALYTKELYRFYIESPEIAGILIDDLQNTVFNDRINKYLPEDVKVAHKIGSFESYGVYNDVGIIFADEPYVLAVMSDGAEYGAACDVIGEISKRIYYYLKNSK